MSESKKIDANSLYSILLRETENDTVQEVSTELYVSISDFVGKLKSEGYDGVEAKVKDALVNMITDLTSLLLKIRLEKATKTNKIDYSNLLDEEKFILDAMSLVKLAWGNYCRTFSTKRSVATSCKPFVVNARHPSF